MDATIVYFLWAMLLGSATKNNIEAYPNVVECERVMMQLAEKPNSVWGCEGWKVYWDQYNEQIVRVEKLPE